MNSCLTFTLQIQWICARSLCHRLFCVAAVMAQISTACSITFFTHVEYTLPLSARGRLRMVRRGGAGRRTRLYHICMVLQQPARNHHQQRDAAWNLSRSLQQVLIQATHHNLCLPHVHLQINPSSPSQISMSSTLPEVP